MSEDETGMNDLTAILVDCLNQCHERGMQLPWLFAAIAINGSMMYARYTANESTDSLDAAILAEHIVGRGLALPINIMIVDATGAAARVLIDKEGVKFH